MARWQAWKLTRELSNQEITLLMNITNMAYRFYGRNAIFMSARQAVQK